MRHKRILCLTLVLTIVTFMSLTINRVISDSRPKSRFQTFVSADQTAYARLDRQAKTLEVYFGDGKRKVDPSHNPPGERYILQNEDSIQELKGIRPSRTRKGTRVVILHIRDADGWEYVDFAQGQSTCSFYASPRQSYYENSFQ